MKNKILFILWVIVICVAFITLVGFSIIYGDRIQNKNLENQESQTSEDLLYKELPKQEIVEEKESEIYLLSAYCPCYECSEGYGNMTATGKRAVEGRTIAVDPDVIEYGTTVYIDNKPYIAEDCGTLVKGKHIDIYFDCHSKVDAFGKKYAEVEI